MLRNWGCWASACRFNSCQDAPPASVYAVPKYSGAPSGGGLEDENASMLRSPESLSISSAQLTSSAPFRATSRDSARPASDRCTGACPPTKLARSTMPYNPPRRFATPRNHDCEYGTGSRLESGKISPDCESGKRTLRPPDSTASHEACAPSLRAACNRLARRAWSSRSASRLAMVSYCFEPAADSAEGLDLGHQLVGVDRFGDVVARALAHAPHPVGLLVLARAHDDGHVGVERVARYRARELEAVLAGHHPVHENEIGLFFREAAERVVGVLRRLHRITLLLQKVRHEHQFGLGIIHDENFRDRHHITP